MSDLDLFPKIGTRFTLSEHTGTIKFVGNVQGTLGIWLGVEWDNPQRGKHSGAKDGVQYFACRYEPDGTIALLGIFFSRIVQVLRMLDLLSGRLHLFVTEPHS
jgi:hypothetical protein